VLVRLEELVTILDLHRQGLSVRPDGAKEVLGPSIQQAERAEFWLRVMPPYEAGFLGTPAERVAQP
jgi:hypothetical protein